METNSKKIIQIDEGVIKAQVGEVVRETVEETLNRLLDAEADEIKPNAINTQRIELILERVIIPVNSTPRPVR